ncbi:hypothetical protein MHBO_001398 [Bonamia ostreae]|uniref:Uncharacterized protein n=1 Tax=Bonamia ostreae TaxID=126728 RepID=A0ABV2AK20_9EUKA
MTYIETLHGHEASITQIAAKNNQNKILSCGEDKTIRVFKIDAGTQLVFKAFSVHSAAIDCCCFLNKSDFIVGSQDGSLSMWTENSKKPIFVEKRAHDGKWITALAIFGGSENKWSDLVATGSSDGFLRFWRILGETGNTQIKQIGKVKLEGYINSLKFNVSRNSLLVGVGREHRFGRWEVIKMAKNQVFEILFD